VAATLIALGFLGFLFSRLGDQQRLLQAALSLVLGGAAGNLVDRVLRGFVIDFVDWHWRDTPGLRWPTFNVADAAITVGFAFMVADSLRALARESSHVTSPHGRGGMPLAAPSSPANPNS
jgi:signal peptidase II